MIDIIFSLNKGFYKEGLIVENRKRILKKYLKSKFFFDIIAIIALFYEDTFVLNLVFVKIK